MTVPRVTIVICTRNRAEKLKVAIEALIQLPHSPSWQALIIDNGSSDSTKQVVQEASKLNPQLAYQYQPVPGLGHSRDFALQFVKSEIVCFTDDDCYVESNFVNSIIDAFDDDLRVSCIGGKILLHNTEDARVTIDERSERELIQPFTYLAAGSFHGANLSFRLDAIVAVGGFDQRLGAGTAYPCEDIDAVARIVWSGRHVAYDPRPAVWHDHGRRLVDIPALERSYDAGRGAYFAKLLNIREARGIYISEWWKTISSCFDLYRARRFYREAWSFLAFSCKSGYVLQVVIACGALPVAYGIAFVKQKLPNLKSEK